MAFSVPSNVLPTKGMILQLTAKGGIAFNTICGSHGHKEHEFLVVTEVHSDFDLRSGTIANTFTVKSLDNKNCPKGAGNLHFRLLGKWFIPAVFPKSQRARALWFASKGTSSETVKAVEELLNKS